MTAIQLALVLSGLPLLTLAAFILFGHFLNSRVPSESSVQASRAGAYDDDVVSGVRLCRSGNQKQQ